MLLFATFAVAEVERQAHTAERAGAAALVAAEISNPPVVATALSETPVLILLHGADLNASMRDPVRRRLNHAWRVIALDLPGHSAHCDVGYSTDGAIAEILIAACSVSSAPAILVGVSLGGYTAILAASVVPHSQLAGLVLGSASVRFDSMARPRIFGHAICVRAPTLLLANDRIAASALGHFPLATSGKRAMLAAGIDNRAGMPAALRISTIDFRAQFAAATNDFRVFLASLTSREP